MFESITQQYSQNPQAGPVQLICTGALSNAAMLLLLYPEVKPLIEITIMGGAMGVSGVGCGYLGVLKGSTVVERLHRACSWV
jgi:inosine-uridine nucleoside N-ribohydrolase